MATQSLPQTILHPAWEAVAKRLRNEERWKLRAFGKPGGYHDWEIALAMCVGGYGADLIVTERDAEGQPKAYAFPDRWIPAYIVTVEPVRGRKQLECNKWLIERVLSDGERLVKLLSEYRHRHASERGYELVEPERSARVVIHKERQRRGLNVLHANHRRFAA